MDNTTKTITGRTPSSPEIQNTPTRPPAPRCLTCYGKLSPPTKVPRPIFVNDQDLVKREAASIKALQERRKQEIEEGHLGLDGEAQFCSGKCAEFYGRAAADLIGLSPLKNLFGQSNATAMDEWSRNLQVCLDKAAGKFQWVAEVRKKRGPK